MQVKRAAVAGAALALLFGLSPYLTLGQSDTGTLRVTIGDKAARVGYDAGDFAKRLAE